MVRVLRCHHFKSQEVFTTDNEPHTMYTAADMVFVAMDQCFIAVHSLKEPGCPEIFRFPTIAPVKQVVYSEAGVYRLYLRHIRKLCVVNLRDWSAVTISSSLRMTN